MAFDAASGSAMKPARMAFVTPVFVTENAFSGGLGSYISRTAQALRDSGHVPLVFVLSEQAPGSINFRGMVVHRVRPADRHLTGCQ